VSKTALIAGASGLVGSSLVRSLIDSPDYGSVVSLGRRGIGWSHPKLKQITADFGTLQLPDDLHIDDVFCTFGTTIKKAGSRDAFRQVDLTFVLQLARACLARGARTFTVVTALGADSHSRFFYSRVKGDLENALRGLGYPSLIILRPSLIIGHRPETRPGETLAEVLLLIARPLLFGPLKKYRPVEASKIAQAMTAAARAANPGVKIMESDQIGEALG
jgi:uncharacterized protein YbjT (DUF2867 family)